MYQDLFSLKWLGDTNKTLSDEDIIDRAYSANSDCDLNPIVPNRTRSVDRNIQNSFDNVKRKPGPSETKPSCDQWSCSLCTFLNHKDLVLCEMCETPKKKVKTKAGIKQTADKEMIKEKLHGEADQIDIVTTEISTKDKRNEAAVKHNTEVVVEFSMNGLKQNRNDDSGSYIESASLKKRKRYSNSLHDLSSSDEEPLENQIENYDSDAEGKATHNVSCIGKSAEFTPKHNPWPQSSEAVSDMQKSETKKSYVKNSCLDAKNDFSSKFFKANYDQDKETSSEVKADDLGDSDCSSLKPGASSGVNTPKKYIFKPFSTPKKYRFKSVDRSLGNSPLTPPPVLNECYAKSIHGSMLKETNCRQSPQSHEVIGKGDLVTKSDTKEKENSKPVLDGFNAKTGKKSKVSISINNVNKSSVEVTDNAEFSSPEMDELYAGVDIEQMEQNNGLGKANVRRQLGTGEN